jgi:hypothetical protein
MRRPPQGDDEGRTVEFEPHDLTGSLPHPKWLVTSGCTSLPMLPTADGEEP